MKPWTRAAPTPDFLSAAEPHPQTVAYYSKCQLLLSSSSWAITFPSRLICCAFSCLCSCQPAGFYIDFTWCQDFSRNYGVISVAIIGSVCSEKVMWDMQYLPHRLIIWIYRCRCRVFTVFWIAARRRRKNHSMWNGNNIEKLDQSEYSKRSRG